MVKMTSFLIQTVKFEFKRNTWINQEPPPSYRPPALGAGRTAWAGSNTGGTTHPRWPIAMQVTQTCSSAPLGGTGQAAVATASGAGGSVLHWNQPKGTSRSPV
jgi:hypothetical protein